MIGQPLYRTYQRYRSLFTHRISTLPIVILMPHSACNCRCVMCDIWKGNRNLKQLDEDDISSLLVSLEKLGTQQIVMSGGEALLNPGFFRLCEILKKKKMRISLLSTGLLLKHHADDVLNWVDDIIVSLDGDEELHDRIRNIPGAFRKLKEGITHLKTVAPGYRITARTVIHRLNFRKWPAIIEAANGMHLDQISFLPADTTSHAFNRKETWEKERQYEVLPSEHELVSLQDMIYIIQEQYVDHFRTRFIAESPEKIQKIHTHYSAMHGRNLFPYKKCNAPWVSAVIEADGTVRPCFFHDGIGNIREQHFEEVLNGEKAYRFRKELDIGTNETCKRCVCYLNLAPLTPVI
jgi:MoaA/NifB/PqqE/SkfB family radical SAM enzyme